MCFFFSFNTCMFFLPLIVEICFHYWRQSIICKRSRIVGIFARSFFFTCALIRKKTSVRMFTILVYLHKSHYNLIDAQPITIDTKKFSFSFIKKIHSSIINHFLPISICIFVMQFLYICFFRYIEILINRTSVKNKTRFLFFKCLFGY